MMLPMVARIHVVRMQGRRRLRLWLPLFLLWLLVLPLAIVALPVAAVVLWATGRRPFAIFAAYWRVLCAIPGTRLEVNSGRASVLVHVQ
jgi:hypothetical protein